MDADTLTAGQPDLPCQLPGEAAVGAVVDAAIPTHGQLARFRPDLESPQLFPAESRVQYVNAGVLLIDVPQWEAQHMGDRCIDLISRSRNCLIKAR